MKFLVVLSMQLLALGCCMEKKLDDYCISKVCLLDAARLIEFASDDELLQPCDDFREFALGKLIQFRSMLDDKSGFLSDTLAHDLRIEKILKAPIKDDDRKSHKIAKNFFQKCASEGEKKINQFLNDVTLYQ
jgi:hypothetical protein